MGHWGLDAVASMLVSGAIWSAPGQQSIHMELAERTGQMGLSGQEKLGITGERKLEARQDNQGTSNNTRYQYEGKWAEHLLIFNKIIQTLGSTDYNSSLDT